MSMRCQCDCSTKKKLHQNVFVWISSALNITCVCMLSSLLFHEDFCVFTHECCGYWRFIFIFCCLFIHFIYIAINFYHWILFLFLSRTHFVVVHLILFLVSLFWRSEGIDSKKKEVVTWFIFWFSAFYESVCVCEHVNEKYSYACLYI